MLTDEELKILSLLSQGATTTRTADLVFLSRSAVHVRLRRAKEVMECHTITHCVAEALRRGLIE